MLKPSTVVNAYLDNDTKIAVKLSEPLTLPFALDDAALTDATTGNAIPIIGIVLPQGYSAILIENDPPDSGTTTESEAVGADSSRPAPIHRPASVQTDLVEITLAQAPDVTHSLLIALKGYEQGPVTPRNVLNGEQYVYRGNDLGNTYARQATSFRLWAPTASDVQLLLFDSETGPLQQQIAMQPGANGTWYAEVSGDWQNWYYLYAVTVHGTTREAVDPYVKAIAVNATRGMITDLQETNPRGWEQDSYVTLTHPEDAIIYEVHVRDFSINPNFRVVNGENPQPGRDQSGPYAPPYQGKYLAFMERGTKGPGDVATGVDHLKELGITHVQLQPVQEFASVDENDPDQYNWGYDPRNFNVPEGAYATNPHGTTRITECKQMIQSLHNEGIGVILDVVYNHTFAVHDSDFDKIVPHYYYRTDYDGNYTNGSGTGNEIAAERSMVQKFILDSLVYWVKEYHVDGFRFDLMALLGVDTMKKVSETLHGINPHILLYGEPWTGGTSGLAESELLTKGRQKGLGIAVFNDNIRDALCGSVFDSAGKGFATGAWGLVGRIASDVEGSINDFAASPGESINYATSHDNYALWDKITLSTPDASEEERIQMDELAQAVVLTSQGIAFLHGGEELLRTKGGNSNSYIAGDAVNQFDWSRKEQFLRVFKYYAGLIHMRRMHPAFCMTSASEIRDHLTFLASPENTLMFEMTEYANGDSWKNILVIYNPNKADMLCPLPPGNWNIVVSQDRISENYLGQASEEVIVTGISCLVMYQDGGEA